VIVPHGQFLAENVKVQAYRRQKLRETDAYLAQTRDLIYCKR